jgi:hypothetical protein
MSFAARMRDLEQKFAAAAAADGDIYLPNFTPSGPVDAILVAMEPSLGRWAKTPAEVAERVAAGFRNFMWSAEDFILHYAARRFLTPSGGSYHVTDVSKGAMTVDKAGIDRRARYARWAALLADEIRLIAKPGARIIAIGQQVRVFLVEHGFGDQITTVLHYSQQAAAARNASVKDREADFRQFAETFSLGDILDVASEVMRENCVPTPMFSETIERLRRTEVSESRKKLAFIYTTAFAALR